jgi:hypothetical protein
VQFAHGLNDRGEIAFAYRLSDGRIGIAIATVPEPSTLGLLAVAVLPLRRYRARASLAPR